MSEFERPQPNYRLAETQFSDTLPLVAAREMADANRWVELVWLNSLLPPYIVDDPRRVAPGVLLSGSVIKIPVPTGWINDDRTNSYESDVALTNRQLTATPTGDLSVATGVDNLTQQLSHRVVTPRGQAVRHPDYGCMIWMLQGKKNGPVVEMLASEYVKSALAADYRVSSVNLSLANIDLDAIRVRAQVTAVNGASVEIRPTGTIG